MGWIWSVFIPHKFMCWELHPHMAMMIWGTFRRQTLVDTKVTEGITLGWIKTVLLEPLLVTERVSC
jgi:hypothetical protein